MKQSKTLEGKDLKYVTRELCTKELVKDLKSQRAIMRKLKNLNATSIDKEEIRL